MSRSLVGVDHAVQAERRRGWDTKHWPRKRTPMKLAGRTALVTGASRGIGRAIARAYVAAGARVVVTGRDADALDALVAELGNAAHAVPGDLAAPETPDSLVAATLA